MAQSHVISVMSELFPVYCTVKPRYSIVAVSLKCPITAGLR